MPVRAPTLPAYLDCQLRAAGVALAWLFREHGYEIGPARELGGLGAGLVCASTACTRGMPAIRRRPLLERSYQPARTAGQLRSAAG